MPWWCWCCFCPPCLSEDDKVALSLNREINRKLKYYKRKERRELKILLLGTGESGKSTFIKQMRILHGAEFTDEERKTYARLIHQNIVTCAQSLVGALETLKCNYVLRENKINGELIKSLDVHSLRRIEKHHAAAIKKLWCDPGILQCYARRSEFQLLDSAYYYLTNLERITQDGYLPTVDDIVRIRMPTTGLNEYCFVVNKVTLRMVDVGGQKSERKKWIHCFENVNALIYLASLSEYDQQLEEKKDENRMKESMALFKQIMALPWFRETPIILFLNKTDLLAEKVFISDLATYFPKFKGPHQDAEAATRFIENTYVQLFHMQTKAGKDNKDEERLIYPHRTCATDTQNISKVFDVIKAEVLRHCLSDYGIL